MTTAVVGNTSDANNYRLHTSTLTMAFVSTSAEGKPAIGSDSCCFRVHGQMRHLVSASYPTEKNTPGHEQLFDSAERQQDCLKADEAKAAWPKKWKDRKGFCDQSTRLLSHHKMRRYLTNNLLELHLLRRALSLAVLPSCVGAKTKPDKPLETTGTAVTRILTQQTSRKVQNMSCEHSSTKSGAL
jgi:hypothetical protein